MHDGLADFSSRPLSFDGRSYDVYTAGTGPAIVVMPEIPGITPAVADFARGVVAAGFTVWVPSLFGEPGKPASDWHGLKTLVKQCVRKEFMAFARSQRAPVTNWLQALVTHAHEQCGGPGVGVVGMCFTGNFALALAVDPIVKVPVMSQPSLPLGPTKKYRRDLHVAPEDLAAVKLRTVDDELCVIGLRFTGDKLVPAERFARLKDELGDAFIGVEIDSSKGNEHGFGWRAHSVLTEEYRPAPQNPTNQAYELVLDHFRKQLLNTGTSK